MKPKPLEEMEEAVLEFAEVIKEIRAKDDDNWPDDATSDKYTGCMTKAIIAMTHWDLINMSAAELAERLFMKTMRYCNRCKTKVQSGMCAETGTEEFCKCQCTLDDNFDSKLWVDYKLFPKED